MSILPKSGVYRLTEDLRNPAPHKGRRGWNYELAWPMGLVFIVYTDPQGHDERPAVILRCVSAAGDPVKLAVPGAHYEEAEDPRWCAIVHRLLARLEPHDDLERQLEVHAREAGNAALFATDALLGLLRAGRVKFADVLKAHAAERAREGERAPRPAPSRPKALTRHERRKAKAALEKAKTAGLAAAVEPAEGKRGRRAPAAKAEA